MAKQIRQRNIINNYKIKINMSTKDKTINMSKTKTKLEEILKDFDENGAKNEMKHHIEQSEIFSHQAILDIKKCITDQEECIEKAYKAKPFDLINLDTAMVRKTLLEDKLNRLEKLKSELF